MKEILESNQVVISHRLHNQLGSFGMADLFSLFKTEERLDIKELDRRVFSRMLSELEKEKFCKTVKVT